MRTTSPTARLKAWELNFERKGELVLRNEDEWESRFRENGAFWVHDGNSERPHALLTSSEMHSGDFFNSRLVIADEALLRDAASDLLEVFFRQGGDISRVEGVVGPQTGATKLAESLSYQVMAHTRGWCFWTSPTKSGDGEKKSMVFSDEDLAKLKGKTVLLCEDVITSGDSVKLAATAVTNAGGVIMPFVLVLVNRHDFTETNGQEIGALVEKDMPTWAPLWCPFCKAGSEAVRPKESWERLNARY